MNRFTKSTVVLLSIFLMACSSKPEPCKHESHDRETLVCSICNEIVDHHFINHRCTMCEETSDFEWERITDKEEFVKGVEHKGTIEKFTYETEAYADAFLGNVPSGTKIEKPAYAYLPYGYSNDKQYNVVVLLHGAGDAEGYWFGVNDRLKEYETDAVYKDCYVYNPNGNITKNVLDYMFDSKMIEDTIIVTPTFYDDVTSGKKKLDMQSGIVSSTFDKEMKNYLLPAIASRYSTYAKSDDSSSLKEARDHFSYIGYSLGAMIGLYSAMTECYEYFGSYALFSGSRGNVEMAANVINGSPLKLNYLYMGVGSCDDFVKDGPKANYDAIRQSSTKIDDSNSAFVEVYETGHFYDSFITQLYNALPELF